jgi:hypothetical protein
MSEHGLKPDPPATATRPSATSPAMPAGRCSDAGCRRLCPEHRSCWPALIRAPAEADQRRHQVNLKALFTIGSAGPIAALLRLIARHASAAAGQFPSLGTPPRRDAILGPASPPFELMDQTAIACAVEQYISGWPRTSRRSLVIGQRRRQAVASRRRPESPGSMPRGRWPSRPTKPSGKPSGGHAGPSRRRWRGRPQQARGGHHRPAQRHPRDHPAAAADQRSARATDRDLRARRGREPSPQHPVRSPRPGAARQG